MDKIASQIDKNELAEYVAALSLPFPVEQINNLALYLEMLMKWGATMNLVGAVSWREALANLVADSFYLAGFLDGLALPENAFIIDPGAGAGLPGIPLRLVWQKGTYCMIEAREKRAIFLSTAVARMSLPVVTVFRGRVEEFFAKNPGTKPDMVISRAFMPRLKLLNMFAEHLNPGGLAVFMSNEPVFEESLPQWSLTAAAPYDGPPGRRWFLAYCHN